MEMQKTTYKKTEIAADKEKEINNMLTIYTKSFITKFLFVTLFLSAANALFAQDKQDNSVQTTTTIPETTEFTYQGRLLDNNLPANGTYDFQFRLTGGSTADFGTLLRNNVQVINGIFTVRLDFGANFPAGAARFLEISLKPVGAVAYTTLMPLQTITATPLAIHSVEATSALFAADSSKLGGFNANQYVLTTDSRLTDDRNPLAGSSFYIQNTSDPQTANFNINGTGTASLFSALTINSAFQYSLGGLKFITAPTGGNTFVGLGTGSFLNGGLRNSFFGNNAGRADANGNDNSFFGAGSGTNNVNGNFNSFFGSESGKAASDSNGNSFFGASSGIATTTGDENSFFGLNAGYNNQTGSQNTYLGAYAGQFGQTGTNNSFIGAYAGSNNTGSNNVFLGSTAGFNNKANENSFIGAESGYQNTTGGGNSFLGYRSGYANTTGYNNSFLGYGAGKSTTTGNGNIFIGSNAGSANQIGSNNIFIGNNTNSQSTDANNNIALGNNITFTAGVQNSIVIGNDGYSNADNQVVLGNQITTTYVAGYIAVNKLDTGGVQSVCINTITHKFANCSSSLRYKENVANFTSGLDLIRRLRPVSYTWKQSKERDIGFIAEEINKVEPLLNNYNEKGEVEGVKYDRISTALVNAVNEQQTEIESQKKQIDDQKTLIESQQKQIDALTKAICAQNPNAEVCREQK